MVFITDWWKSEGPALYFDHNGKNFQFPNGVAIFLRNLESKIIC